jgi:UDP-glucose 4-epimerase
MILKKLFWSICHATDKALLLTDAMEISKALTEKVVIAKSRGRNDIETVLSGTCY